MATHDYLIDNQTGANFRVDLNNVLSAIVSNNSDPLEPTTKFAYMFWADTTANVLKLRNSSNTAWVTIFNLTGISLDDLTDGVYVVDEALALGFQALINNTGFNNTAIGQQALMLNTAGSDNTALGRSALAVNTTGNHNSALGKGALMLNTTGSYNTATGKEAAKANTSGYDNTANGFRALEVNTTGIKNTAYGSGALSDNTTGSNNVAVGAGAGATSNFDNTITLGANTVPLGTNYLTFGKNGGTDRVYNQFTANATWIRVSDERIKKDIETNKDCGLAFINALRTVTYKFKAPSELDPSLSEYDKDNDTPSHDKAMYGFIAQEVKETLDKLNIKDFAGWHVDENGKDKLQGISYEMFVMPLVKSVQELVIENQGLSDRIDEQNAAIDDITNRLEALE